MKFGFCPGSSSNKITTRIEVHIQCKSGVGERISVESNTISRITMTRRGFRPLPREWPSFLASVDWFHVRAHLGED